ncbi:MAG: hypothetical protein IPK53_18475 [bacterium]|nr:hypothetical protein [bacterium]
MNHPNLQDQEAALMARFRLAHANENYLNFIQDGIVNHEQYLHASPKIVFLLREPHWETKDEDTRREFSMISDLSEGVRNRKDWRNWHIIVRWASALLDGNSISWEDLRPLSLDNEFRKKQLNRVAIVNIKKSGGARSLNWATFIEYAKRHKKLVTDQIELYSPDVIVCSGRFV